ncbi:hypothetical protein C8R45DRAFT_949534 [Mycena sanguinolenta]|nr:hypothetical protein C8R45DRAFT_949534 [Mycena sanguinolenta]
MSVPTMGHSLPPTRAGIKSLYRALNETESASVFHVGPSGKVILFDPEMPPDDFELLVNDSDDPDNIAVIRDVKPGLWAFRDAPEDLDDSAREWRAMWVSDIPLDYENLPTEPYETPGALKAIEAVRREDKVQVGVCCLLDIDTAKEFKETLSGTRAGSTAVMLELYAEFGEGVVPGGCIFGEPDCRSYVEVKNLEDKVVQITLRLEN